MTLKFRGLLLEAFFLETKGFTGAFSLLRIM